MTLPLHDLRVSVLGEGRVGTSLSASLRSVGARVRLGPARDRPETADASLVLITVSDSALAGVVDALHPVPGQVIAHTSGRHGLAVLAGVRTAGAHALAFHPALPFAGAPVDLTGAAIGLTADPDALPLAERLCEALGARPVWIAEQQRDLYHAALCHSANHLVTLIAEAAELLIAAGLTAPADVLRPLTEAALQAALRDGAAATTGPVVRGDAETVAAHVAAIRRTAPEISASYLALAQRTAEYGVLGGVLDSQQARTITAALQGVRA